MNKADENDHPKIDYTWVNVGRGPAIVSDVLTMCQTTSELIPIIPADDNRQIKHGQFAIGSGATVGTSGPNPLPQCLFDRTLTGQDWEAIAAKHEFVLFSGFIRYQDSFHKYKWHFGALYEAKFFSNGRLPAAYNYETQENETK